MSNEVADKALVLVVDDEPQIRRLLRASLEMSGYGVVEAANGSGRCRASHSLPAGYHGS